MLARMPAEPARHRMALWRDLRRSGAVLVGQAAWAVPNLPAVRPMLDRIAELVETAHGSLLVLDADGHTDDDTRRLEQLYVEARRQEWSEFEADCDKYLAELEHEEADAVSTPLLSWRRKSRAWIDSVAGTASSAAADLLGVPAAHGPCEPL